MLVQKFCSSNIVKQLQAAFFYAEDPTMSNWMQYRLSLPERKVSLAALVAGFRGDTHQPEPDLTELAQVHYLLSKGSKIVSIEITECSKVNLAGLVTITCNTLMVDKESTNLNIRQKKAHTLPKEK